MSFIQVSWRRVHVKSWLWTGTAVSQGGPSPGRRPGVPAGRARLQALPEPVQLVWMVRMRRGWGGTHAGFGATVSKPTRASIAGAFRFQSDPWDYAAQWVWLKCHSQDLGCCCRFHQCLRSRVRNVLRGDGRWGNLELERLAPSCCVLFK